MRSRRLLPRQSSLILPEIVNPFVHRLNLSLWQIIKIAIMSVTVAPIRLLLIFILAVISVPIAYIATFGRTESDDKTPITGWRRSFRWPLIIMGRLVFWLAGFHYVKIIGRPALCRDAAILVCAPHTGYIDLILGFVIDLPSGVSRWENKNISLFGNLIKYTQPIFVKRGDPNSRQKTIEEITRRAKSRNWPPLVIFPEGTTTNGQALITFKIGAFAAGEPVQPVCIRFPNLVDTTTWTWDGPNAYKLLWITLCQFHNYCEIEFLPVYNPSKEEKADTRLFANNVRCQMSQCLTVPATDHTLEDCHLMMYAHQLHLPMASGIVEFRKLNKKLGVNFDKMKTLLNKFSTITKKTEHITLQQFSDYLDLPVSDALYEVFYLYDRDGSNSIDFREYLIGLSLISEPANNDATIQMTFKLFDSENKGYISEPQLNQILHTAFDMHAVDIKNIFQQIDTDDSGHITFSEFKAYAQKKPELARLFLAYQTKTTREEDEAETETEDMTAQTISPIDTTSTSTSSNSIVIGPRTRLKGKIE